MRFSPFAPLDRLLLAPPAGAAAAFLIAQPFAHRGLHGRGIPENSRAAVSAAIAAGHGVEIDVRGSWDGEAFLSHDADLDRLAEARGPLAKRSARELDAIRLRGHDEAIPRLTAILALVAGRVPVLIELKTDGEPAGPLCLSVRRALEGYRGAAAVMSFDPAVGRWFSANAARIPRGIVMSMAGARGFRRHLARRAALWRSRAQFLACDVRDLPGRLPATLRARGLPVLAWTVRDPAAARRARASADQIIYERPA